MEALFLLVIFLAPGLLAATAKRFWATMLALVIGFGALIITIAWWPIGLLLWAVAWFVAIRAHRVAWRERERERSSE